MTTILIMGLPGSGKSTLAKTIKAKLEDNNKSVNWYNADEIRKEMNDWDFSYTGRLRQTYRMKKLAKNHTDGFTIIDMVAPLPEFRKEINADIIIWVNTIEEGRFEDTNKMFINPEHYDFRVTSKNADDWSNLIISTLC